MAYDFFYRKWVPKNIALTSLDVSTSATTAPSNAEKTYLARLAVLKMNADAGNKKAKKAWKSALKDLKKLLAAARNGNPKALHTLAVIRESGLFSGVNTLTISGADNELSPKGRSLVSLLGKVKNKALQGDPRAISLVAAVNTLHLEQVPGTNVAGDEELVEELKTRADAGDVRSQKRLEAMRQRSRTSGDEGLTGQQAARKILEDAADAKVISRNDLKKAISLYTGPTASDREKIEIGSKVLAFLKKKNVQITT